ncbi:hypothetical protein BAE30_02235 [Acidithiobacillus caldus]|uniref:Uncharacterized protein n=1 Tax=Acidithiobacillus caldus TaxID=33059 RepID=A0A1E7Z0P4_9PROT|nr:hypothetical protein BAE30_02235 [Acidithiobacillus caldus]
MGVLGGSIEDKGQEEGQTKKPKLKVSKKVAIPLVGGVALAVALIVAISGHEGSPGDKTPAKLPMAPSAMKKTSAVGTPGPATRESTQPEQGLLASHAEIPAPAATAASAQIAGTPPAQQVQNLLTSASGGDATLVKEWPGPGGLTGIEYRVPDGSLGQAWIDFPKGLVLIGTLVGSNGKNYNTSGDFDLAATQSPVAETASVAAAAATAEGTVSGGLSQIMTGGNGFVVGNKGPQVTVFIDPNSTSGNQLYLDLYPMTQTGKLRVRFVPISVKEKSSLSKAEQILSAPNPAKELDVDERLFVAPRHGMDGRAGGGIKGVPNTLAMMSEVDGNTALIASAGYVDPVVLAYCDKQGAVKVLQGSQAIVRASSIPAIAGTCK